MLIPLRRTLCFKLFVQLTAIFAFTSLHYASAVAFEFHNETDIPKWQGKLKDIDSNTK